MNATSTLSQFLADHASASATGTAVAATVGNLARAAALVAARIAEGASSAALAEEGAANTHGEVQKALDVIAHEAFVAAAAGSPVVYLLSEEADEPLTLSGDGLLALAIDPLDGSSNIAINAPIGTIFGLFAAHRGSPEQSFLRKGRELLAAGYFIYGARTEFVLSLGGRTTVFALDAAAGGWQFHRHCDMPRSAREFAINMSNYRHWPDAVRRFVDQCLDGRDGALGEDYNMRWLAALAGEAHRVLTRGGIFLYPRDRRRGYAQGRLRLLYECFPIAFLVEKAGGVATDGATAMLEVAAGSYHQKSPLCFGSADQMAALARAAEGAAAQASPLFAARGLLRVEC